MATKEGQQTYCLLFSVFCRVKQTDRKDQEKNSSYFSFFVPYICLAKEKKKENRKKSVLLHFSFPVALFFYLRPVVRKPISANPRLNVVQGPVVQKKG